MAATRRGGSRFVTLATSAVFLLGSALSNPGIAATTLCDEPPDVVPVDDLAAGDIATGWTVVEGTDPVSFDVEIVGVIPDGIALGLDFILIHTSGPVIDETGGIAAGFSGSPVYIGDDLVGAVSYGFFGADQTFGGVTPAENMVELFDYPSGTGAFSAGGAMSAPSISSRVRIPTSLRERAARTTAATLEEVGTVAEPLKVPLGVSGLNTRGMKKFSRTLKLAGLPVMPYKANASASVPTLDPTPLEAGQSVAGALSVGDLTSAGIGTATAICGDLLVGFGHPFFFDGEGGEFPMAMYGAEVLTVLPDPSNLFGGFKIANITDLHGIVDQDRLAGIRGVHGIEPSSVPITSVVSNPELERIRSGETTVFRQEIYGFPYVPDLAAFHLLANEDAVFDRIGDGSVDLEFTVEGIDPDGNPFQLIRPNIWFSDYDASFESIFEMYGFLFRILDNPFGDVTITGVDMEATITEEHLTSEIIRVESASSLEPVLEERGRLRVRPGDTIQLNVVLQRDGAVEEDVVELLVPVPRSRSSRGDLIVAGGGYHACLFCFFDGGNGEGDVETFGELRNELDATPRNNDLVADVHVGRRDRSSSFRADTVILGRERINIIVVR
jgi:SpoIVB peptidase S55